MTNLWQITAIIKIEADAPKDVGGKEFYCPCSNSSPTVPFKFCICGQNTLRLELFQSTKRQVSVLILSLFNQGIHIERVWTGGLVWNSFLSRTLDLI